MAHLDGKMKEDGVPFNSIEDQRMIQTGDDWKELRDLISIRECVE